MNKKHHVYVLLIIFLGTLLRHAAYAKEPLTWAGVRQAIRQEFPGIPFLSTQQLFEYLSNPDTVKPVLLDARAPGEYAVSHIQGARNAEKKKDALKILENVRKDTFIVVYCSVGYRSASLVGDLLAQGYTNVYNLEGSVFEWANEGKPVYNTGNKQVKSVHPYDQKWGALLKKDLRAPVKTK